MFAGKSSAWFVGTIAGIAHLAERRTCKAQVFGSSPNTGSSRDGVMANMLDPFSGAPGSSPGPAI